MPSPNPKTEYRPTPNTVMDKISQPEQCITRSQGAGSAKLENFGSNPTNSPTHRFGFDVNEDKVHVTYQYQADVAVGFNVNTNFILGLFK